MFLRYYLNDKGERVYTFKVSQNLGLTSDIVIAEEK